MWMCEKLRGSVRKSKVIAFLHSRFVFLPPQIPEQDETYAEDSFCVAEGDEETCKKNGSSEEEEVCVNFDLLNNESFGGGRQRYLTRRRKKLHRAKMEQNCSVPGQKKPSRIIVLSDSSGEETSVSNEKGMASHCSRAEQENAELRTTLPSVSSVPHKKTAGDISARQSADSKSGMLLGLKASVSEMLDFHPGPRSSSGKEALLAPAEVGVGAGNDLSLPCSVLQEQLVLEAVLRGLAAQHGLSASGEGGEEVFCMHCSVIPALLLPQEAFLLAGCLSTQ